ncbi:MAG: DUF3429 domain-containing protein [Acetobacteraceae bacterium]|nr:DUF3429 domain-containing protein [Acetobacteraceae bacterium]
MSLGDRRLTGGAEQPMTAPPPISLFLAFIALVPVLAGTALVLAADDEQAAETIERPTIGWAAAVLCFLGGVRRGLSFRQPGGTMLRDLADMFTLFVFGTGGLLLPKPRAAATSLLLGYATLGLRDRAAAQHGEAPSYFAQLRPVQVLLPLGSLLALLLRGRKA